MKNHLPAPAAALVLLLGSGRVAAQTADPCTGLVVPADAQCSSLKAPEDRQTPGGRQIPIRFVILRAVRPSADEPVFLFAGGPGEGSTALVELATGPFASVNTTRDIVMVDQRGTGGSNPLRCPVDLVAHPNAAFGHVFDPVVFADCRATLEKRADLKLYTTERAVEDVDQVRAFLGYDKILMWGGSYGTRIAQAYLKAYPNRVTAAVLDGVVPFDFAAPSSYAVSLQQSFDRVVADCQESSGCREKTPELAAAFGRLVAKLRQGPVPATVRRRDSSMTAVTMHLGDFGYAVRGLLYSSGGARMLPAMIATADRTGDLSPFAQRYWNRAADFNADFADGLHFAVFCGEDVRAIREDQVERLVSGTFIGRYLIDEYRTICADWPRASVSGKGREPVASLVPVLLVSGWFDPVTPPETAMRVAARLPNARQLVVRNEAHGAGFGCAAPAVLYVLTKGTLNGLPTVCEGVVNLFDSAPR